MTKTYVIVAAVVKCQDMYLIGKRASTKKFAANKWEFISGFMDTKETAEEVILRELKEETGLKGKIVGKAAPYEFIDKESRWIVAPFLIKTITEKFRLNTKDHSELRWVTRQELKKYKDLKELNCLISRKLV